MERGNNFTGRENFRLIIFGESLAFDKLIKKIPSEIRGVQFIEKCATGAFFEDFVAKIIHLWGAIFLKKAPHTPAKKRLI